MQARDRLPELISKYGDKIYNETTIQIFPLSDNEEKILNIIKQVEKIRKWIDDINERTLNMKRLCSEPTFQASQQMQDEIDSSMTICSANGLKIYGALREFQDKVNPDAEDELDIISRVIELQYYATSKLYAEALSEHQNFLNKYRESRISILRKQMKLTKRTISEEKCDEECEGLLETNNIAIFVGNIEAETKEAQMELRQVEIRHKELLKIENALKEVREKFIQLGTIVALQQSKIDTVEYFANKISSHVDEGNKHLEKGYQNKIKSKKKQTYIMICLIVGALIMIMVLVLT